MDLFDYGKDIGMKRRILDRVDEDRQSNAPDLLSRMRNMSDDDVVSMYNTHPTEVKTEMKRRVGERSVHTSFYLMNTWTTLFRLIMEQDPRWKAFYMTVPPREAAQLSFKHSSDSTRDNTLQTLRENGYNPSQIAQIMNEYENEPLTSFSVFRDQMLPLLSIDIIDTDAWDDSDKAVRVDRRVLTVVLMGDRAAYMDLFEQIRDMISVRSDSTGVSFWMGGPSSAGAPLMKSDPVVGVSSFKRTAEYFARTYVGDNRKTFFVVDIAKYVITALIVQRDNVDRMKTWFMAFFNLGTREYDQINYEKFRVE